MSEQELHVAPSNAATGAAGEEAKKTVEAPAIDVAKIAADARAEALKAVGEQLSGSNKKISDMEKRLENQNAHLRRAAGIEDEEQGVSDLTRSLLLDPEGTLKAYGEAAAQTAIEAVSTKFNEATAIKVAGQNVLKERPDIATNLQAQTYIEKAYGSTDKDKPIAERMKDAVREYDLFVEGLGLGKAEDRVAAAGSVSSSNASGRSAPQGREKFAGDLDKQWQEKEHQRWRATRGLPTNTP